jgi:heme oxygenase (biliverdin-producing, ferredoxin)
VTLPDRLRSATGPLHRQVEATPFVRALLGGRIQRRGYALLLRSLHTIYAALEAGLARQAQHPSIVSIASPALLREQALADDLAVVHGPRWADELEPCPAARAYAQHLHALGDTRPDGLVAHAYVRYLGDLSGGQVLQRVVGRALSLQGGEGLRFYDFGDADQVSALANGFRAGLTRIVETAADTIVDEAVRGFAFHDRLFAELAEPAGVTAPPEHQPLAEKLQMRP